MAAGLSLPGYPELNQKLEKTFKILLSGACGTL